jgi:CelD/BcsL family acetyltransferase involved in cellulose biosynthesis
VSVEVVTTDVAGLVARRADWDALLWRQPLPDPTRSAGWLAAWWGAYGAPRRGRTPHVLLAEEGGRLVGGMALMSERAPAGLRLLRNLGASSHWFDPSPLIDEGRHDVLAALGRAVAGLPADLVVLEDLVAGAGATAALTAGIPGAREIPQGERRHRYRADRPPRLRSRRKETRRLERRAREAGRLEVEVLEDHDRILEGIDDAIALVERAWRTRGDASEITGPVGRAYLLAALASLEPGAAVMSRVVRDGRLAAFDLALRHGVMAVIFRGNWDPDSGVSGAGWMSMLALFDHLEERGVQVIDLGKFAWSYKRSLVSPPVQELATVQAARGVGGMAGRVLWRTRPHLLSARARARTLATRLAPDRGRE